MKKFKKSTWLIVALFLYVTFMAIYFLPRNTELSDWEKYATAAAAYIVVIILWFATRRKEKLAAERRKDINKQKDE